MSDDRCSPTGKRASMSFQGIAAPDVSASFNVVLRVSEGDIRMVDAFYAELALDASEDRSPPTAEEQVALQKLAASFERLKAMTREELLAERARRLRQRR